MDDGQDGRCTELQALRARVQELEQAETSYQQTIQVLQADRAQLQAIIQSMSDAVYIGGPDGIWTCNEPALHMLGFESADDLMHNIGELAERIQTRDVETRERLPSDDEPFAHALRGATVVREVLIQHLKTGQEVIVRCAAAPIWCAGAIIGAVAINTDISAQKAAEAERAQLHAETQDALAARDQAIALAAHELKTPVTAILGTAQLIQRRHEQGQLKDAQATRSFQALVGQTRRLHRMLLSLLDIDRIQRGELALTSHPLDLTSLAYDMVAELQPTLDRHTLVAPASAGPLVIEGDLVQLEQVVYNLLQNAVKYSPEGGTIEVEARCEAGRACLRVRDPGIGIPAQAMPHLFERFYRAPNVAARQISGLGIGLSVVHEIVTRHQGTISVESEEGQGSTFTICLPLTQG